MGLEKRVQQQIQRTVENYGNAAYALDVLTQALKVKAVDINEAHSLIEEENQKKSPSLLGLIEALAASKKLASWNQGVLEATVTMSDNKVYEIQITKSGEDQYQIEIKKSYIENDTGLKKQIEIITENSLPTFIYNEKDNSLEIEVKDHTDTPVVSFNKQSAKPRALQISVIREFAKHIKAEENAALAILGTGTGKSWVMAGITHALPGQSVIVVPNSSLANETRDDALNPLHGSNVKVILARDLTVKEFEQVINDPKAQIILQADDKDFAAKAALITNKVVCIDESHQHTYDEESTERLKALKDNNVLLALTATPTSRLMKEIFNGKIMMEKNLKWAIENGIVRRMYPHIEDHIEKKNLTRKVIVDYFGNDKYLEKSGASYLSPEFVKKSLVKNPGRTDLKNAVDKLVSANRLRGSEQKNFSFVGDAQTSAELGELYNKLRNGETVSQSLLNEISQNRYDNEVAIRTQYYEALGVSHKNAIMFAHDDTTKKELSAQDIQSELVSAQKVQIAQAVNGHALSVFFGLSIKDGRNIDMEKLLRIGAVDQDLEAFTQKPIDLGNITVEKSLPKLINQAKEYANDKTNLTALGELQSSLSEDGVLAIQKLISHKAPNGIPTGVVEHQQFVDALEDIILKDLKKKYTHDALIQERINGIAKNLPQEQRALFIEQVTQVVQNLEKAFGPGSTPSDVKPTSLLLQASNVNLAKMKATYVIDADSSDANDNANLDLLRCGLTMHLRSTHKNTTGTSIPSVLSTQQVLTSMTNGIRDIVETLQLFGRPIRDKDSGAKVSQFVQEGVENYPHLEELVLAEEQRGELDKYFEKEQQIAKKSAHVQTAKPKQRAKSAKAHIVELTDTMDKDVSDEEMLNSAFGQSCLGRRSSDSALTRVGMFRSQPKQQIAKQTKTRAVTNSSGMIEDISVEEMANSAFGQSCLRGNRG